jgi:hypothetical protein
MLRNFCTFLLALYLACSPVLFGQTFDKSNAFKKFKWDPEIRLNNTKKLKKQVNQKAVNISSSPILKFDNAAGLIDTLSYRKAFGGDWTNEGGNLVGFGYGAQDVMIQWYQAPLDLHIKAVGIGTSTNENNQPASVKIVKINNYDIEKFIELIASDSLLSARLGYYPGVGDGYNNIAPFLNDATGSASGGWVGIDGLPEPFAAEDYWSELGFGISFTPTPQPYENNGYNWIEMNILGYEPTVLRGEIFGIAVSNTGNSVTDRQAFWAQSILDNNLNVYPLLKFYEYERNLGTGNYGWWIRPLTLDFVAIVDIFGDEPPQFVAVDELPTTLSTEAREVTATITDRHPGGGAAGVQSVMLHYSTDGAFWNLVPMNNTGGDVWSAFIPGYPSGTIVEYFVQATDVGNNTSQSSTFRYHVFQPTPGINTLIVYNGWDEVTEDNDSTVHYYYFTKVFDHDSWAYGDLTEGLVNGYSTIIEITSSNNVSSDNREVIKNWLSAGNKNYMLIGSEWLGFLTLWTDSTYAEGTFQRDVLGVTADYNDIEFDHENFPIAITHIFPQPGTLLGDSLFIYAGSDTVWYAPFQTGVAFNWIDGIDVVDGQVVDIKAKSTLSGGMYNVGTHREFNGNKIVFLAFDPVALNGNRWFGYSSAAPQNQAINWFGLTTEVKQINNNIPGQFSLRQNYPNPFNPSTLIEYSIPVSGNVTLTIFDILGRKVIDLVNTYQQAGNFSASWDGTNQLGAKVTSGTYFYQLRTDNGFVKTEKMVLLK